MELVFNVDRVAVWENEEFWRWMVAQIMWMCLMSLNCTPQRWLKEVLCHLCFTTVKKNQMVSSQALEVCKKQRDLLAQWWQDFCTRREGGL